MSSHQLRMKVFNGRGPALVCMAMEELRLAAWRDISAAGVWARNVSRPEAAKTAVFAGEAEAA